MFGKRKGKKLKPWISKKNNIYIAAKKREARKANRQQEYKAFKGAVQDQMSKKTNELGWKRIPTNKQF